MTHTRQRSKRATAPTRPGNPGQGNAVVYLRSHADIVAIDKQWRLCLAWCNEQGILVVGAYVDLDPAGRRLRELERDAASGNFRRVVVASLDRISRDILMATGFILAMDDLGIEVWEAAKPGSLTGFLREVGVAESLTHRGS